jgi:hypothetical protein
MENEMVFVEGPKMFSEKTNVSAKASVGVT